MASKQSLSDSDYKSQMEEFPCTFNLAGQVLKSLRRQKAIKLKRSFEQEYTSEENSEKIMWKKNMLTWIYFGLGERWKARELNDELFETGNHQNNITVLGNRVFLKWQSGDEQEANDTMEKLKTLKQEGDFDFFLAQAKAEQAYCHNRTGGLYHIHASFELYKEALKIRPDYALWQFGLGLAATQMTRPKLRLSTDYSTPDKAAECLFKVIDNDSTDSNLQSEAFAQLIVLRQRFPHSQYSGVFRGQSIHQLREKAIETGSENPSVLILCGRSLKYIDIDKAISYVEKAVTISKENNFAHALLGLCYEKKAELKAQGPYGRRLHRGDMYRPTTSWPGQQHGCNAIQQNRNRCTDSAESSRGGQAYTSTHHNKQTSLDREDDLVKLAIQAFQKSIELTYDGNVTPEYHLARILKRTGQLAQSLIHFDRVTSFPLTYDTRLMVVNALEDAGLCYLEMFKSAEEPEKSDLLTKGKKKLLMAVSLAVEMTRRKPELDGSKNDIWRAFRTLSTELEHEKLSPGVAKQKIRLLELVKNYDDILQVIKDLRELGEDIYEDFLKRHMKFQQYEDAVASIRMLNFETKTTQGDSWKRGSLYDLRIKILLRAILERLQTHANPQELCQQLFEMTYGLCCGVNDNEKEALDSSDSFLLRDVLLVFGEDDLSDSSKGRSTSISQQLKLVLSDIFGLDVEEHMQGNRMEALLQERMRFQVVMIIVDDNNRSSEFQAVLKRISCLPNTNPPTIIVLDAGDQNSSDAAPVLRRYRRMKLQDIGDVSGITSAAAGGEARISTINAIVNDVFHRDIEAVMRIFCFIVGKQWPC